MNKASLKKTVSAVVVAATITTLSPLGVSAQWRQNADSTWNYAEGNTIAQGWKNISDIWYYFNSNGKMNTGWICDKEHGTIIIIREKWKQVGLRTMELGTILIHRSNENWLDKR